MAAKRAKTPFPTALLTDRVVCSVLGTERGPSGANVMDWNLNRSQKERMADRELDSLEAQIEQRPKTKFNARANSVNLQDQMQVRNCVDKGKVKDGPGSNKISWAFKQMNTARNKWFDAK
jgi:hypothetical protein